MKKRALLISVLILFAMSISTTVMAGTTIDQVKQNVVKLWKPVKESQPHVTAVEFKKIMDSGEKFILLDVRTEAEYEAAHLPGAINISRGLLEFKVTKEITDPDAKIYLYCRTGARSALATQRLIDIGYKNATNIYDAFKGWVVAGYPVYNRHGEFTLVSGGFEKKE